MVSLIDGLIDRIPIRLWKPLIPDRIAFYGHVVSDRSLPQGTRYRYPNFTELTEFLRTIVSLGMTFTDYPGFMVPGGGKKALLTFDDGFVEILTELHPFLKARGIPYMVFILGAPVLEPDFEMEPFRSMPVSPKPNHLSRSDVETLASDGVAIGYHTRSHYRVTEATPLDGTILLSELLPDPEVESLLTRPKAFAYPFMAPRDYRAYDKILEEAGFTARFDTRGLRDAEGGHVFRVPMDAPVGWRGRNCLISNLKRCLKSRLVSGLRAAGSK